MFMKEFDRYMIATHFIGVLANGDISGLTDDEEKDCEAFAARFPLSRFTLEFPPVDNSEFCKCAISGLMADCYPLVVWEDIPDYTILNIDGWRDPDGSWYWNDQHKLNQEFPAELMEPENRTPRRVLKWFRDNGILSEKSTGRVSIEDDDNYLTIIAKGTREPLFAIQYQPI